MRRAAPPIAPVLWRFALSIAVSSPLAVDAARSAAVAPSSDRRRIASQSLSYRVTVDAPSPLKETLLREVGLARWQGYSEMTEDLLARLAREAVDETRTFAAAEGFFSAAIDVKIDRSTTPIAVTLVVDTGAPTRIASVRIAVTGPATRIAARGRSDRAHQAANGAFPKARRSSSPHGRSPRSARSPRSREVRMRRRAWCEARRRSTPSARARILSVELASGPAFGFGQFEITGLSKYDPSIVRNYSTIAPGTPYSDVALNQFVRRLNSSGYFASVQAKIDPETTHPEDATVNIAVIEARPKRFEGGIGYSTDVQFRASASYRDVNFDGHGLQFLADARLETRIQSGSVKFQRPPNESGWIATYGAGAERTDIEESRHAHRRDRHALALDRGNRSARDLRDLLPRRAAPARVSQGDGRTRSTRSTSGTGAASTISSRRRPATRWAIFAGRRRAGRFPRAPSGACAARYAAWVPLGKDNELNFRAEGGAVLAGSRNGVPSKLLFRTGGSTTVRGYDFESLGVPEGDAIVPGRYYAVASVDAIHWINEFWGVAAFVDAGNAVDSLSDAHLALGYGVGGARAHAARSVPPRRRVRPGRAPGARPVLRRPHVLSATSWPSRPHSRATPIRLPSGAGRLPRALLAAGVLLGGDHRRGAAVPRELNRASTSSCASSSRGAAARS